jgi:hypothetical protein
MKLLANLGIPCLPRLEVICLVVLVANPDVSKWQSWDYYRKGKYTTRIPTTWLTKLPYTYLLTITPQYIRPMTMHSAGLLENIIHHSKPISN